jgi:formyl-CoA transferase
MSDRSAEFDFLSGVKIVDFTQFEAGPSCTEALAWFGAEVVKVENPGMGDPGRRLRKGQPDDDPYYFHMFNANKKSITVNLKDPRGLELVKSLLRKADICVENMAPGTIERLGLGYDDVKAINPGIIYAQVKGFGTGSPWEKSLAFDMIAQAAGGTISVTGEKGRRPVKPGISLGDTGTGMTMAISILAALRKRDKTGQGFRLQVAMQDAMLHYMRTNLSTQARTGKPVERNGGSPGGNNAPSGLFPCAPGGPNDWVYIMTSRANPEHWVRLCKAMGREEIIDDPRLRSGGERGCAERHHYRMDPGPHEAGSDAPDLGRQRSGRGGVRHDGAAERPEFRGTGHHADLRPPDAWQVQDAGLAGAGRWPLTAHRAVTGAGPAHRRGADRLAGDERERG